MRKFKGNEKKKKSLSIPVTLKLNNPPILEYSKLFTDIVVTIQELNLYTLNWMRSLKSTILIFFEKVRILRILSWEMLVLKLRKLYKRKKSKKKKGKACLHGSVSHCKACSSRSEPKVLGASRMCCFELIIADIERES